MSMKIASFPYPVETLKHWYVSPVGGLSADLKVSQIGLNREALAENTDLVPYEDRVLISRLEGSRIYPLFTKKYFTVIPLDEMLPDALSKSPAGEVVFPVQNRKQRNFFEPFKIGEQVILNSVLSRRYTDGFAGAVGRFIRERSGLPALKYKEK